MPEGGPCREGVGCGWRIVGARPEREARSRRWLRSTDIEECCGHSGGTEGLGASNGQVGGGLRREQAWGIRDEVWGRCAHLPLALHPHDKFKLPSKKRAHLEAHPVPKPCPFPGRPSPCAARSFHVPSPREHQRQCLLEGQPGPVAGFLRTYHQTSLSVEKQR